MTLLLIPRFRFRAGVFNLDVESLIGSCRIVSIVCNKKWLDLTAVAFAAALIPKIDIKTGDWVWIVEH